MVKRVSFLKKCFRSCLFTIALVSVISGLILYFGRQTDIAAIFIVTLSAWLASDILILGFLRGGNGILQIPIFGNKTQFRAYGFMVFFIAIFAISIGINIMTDQIIAYLSDYFAMWYLDLGIGLSLSLLVFLDLNAKYYTHDK
jgi:hypothetical protein